MSNRISCEVYHYLSTFIFQDYICYYEILPRRGLKYYWLGVTFSIVPFEQNDGWLPFVVGVMASFINFDEWVWQVRENVLRVNGSRIWIALSVAGHL